MDEGKARLQLLPKLKRLFGARNRNTAKPCAPSRVSPSRRRCPALREPMKLPETRQAIGWVVALLKHPENHENLVAAKADAVRAEDTVVKAIDAAITSKQEAASHSGALAAAWAEQAVVDTKAKEAEVFAKRFIDGNQTAETRFQEALEELEQAKEAKEEALNACANAGELAAAAMQAAKDTEEELDKVTEEFEAAQHKARQDEEVAKKAKKEYERAVLAVDETKKAAIAASAHITKSEDRSTSKLERSHDLSRKACEAETIRDEVKVRWETAVGRIDEFDGTCKGHGIEPSATHRTTDHRC